MPEIPRTKFNSPWTVAVIEAALNDVSSAKGSSESLTAALNAMRAEIDSLSGGVHLKGAVDYYNNLPASPSEGDAYTVRYQGTSGTDPLGIEYAWATYQGTPQWIPIGVDPSVFAKQTEMDVVANAGAKSLLPIGVSSITYYGAVTFSVADDGQITVNGTNPNTSNGIVYQDIVTAKTQQTETRYTLPVGRYKITGTGTEGLRFQVHCHDGTNTHELFSKSNSGEFNYTESLKSQYPYICWRILIVANSSFSNHVVKPMIWDAAITDSTFMPYAKTNRELTVLTDEDRAAIAELIDGGAKNVLKTYNVPSTTTGNVTYSVTDGVCTVSINGTQSSAKVLLYAMDSDVGTTTVDSRFTIPKGKYILKSTGNGKVKLRAYEHDGVTATLLAETTGSDAEFTYSGTNPYVTFTLSVSSNTSLAEPLTFSAFCCTKAAWDISHAYQPYRPSWQEMWDAIQALQSGGNRALTMQTEPEEQEER